jgi:hypothetical protein
MVSWRGVGEVACHCKPYPSFPTKSELIIGPDAGRDQFQQMVVRVAEIDAAASFWPLEFALNRDVALAEASLPFFEFFRRNPEGNVTDTRGPVRWDKTKGECRSVWIAAGEKKKQYLLAADIEGAKALIERH